MRKQTNKTAQPAPKTRVSNGARVGEASGGQAFETDRPLSLETLSVRGQTSKASTEQGREATSFISAIVGHAQTLTVTTLNINVNTNSPATSANAHGC